MVKVPKRHRQPWTRQDDVQLRKEVRQNAPTRVLALHLHRTENAVRARAQELGVSLKPTNRSPYGTAGKRRRCR